MKSIDRYFNPIADCCEIAEDTKLNNPFDYTPSPIILEAQRLLLNEIESLSNSDTEVSEELSRGKMFGVMVVRDRAGRIGYLSAFSGCMAGRIEMPPFVPPIDGRAEEHPDFDAEDRRIGEMGGNIKQLRNESYYIDLESKIEVMRGDIEREIARASSEYLISKSRREELRKATNDPQILEQLQRESQHQKGEMRRMESRLKGELKRRKMEILEWRKRINELIEIRREASNRLQQRMFAHYRVLNVEGERQSLLQIFDKALHRLPPSGAGECAAPKLLHFCLSNSLKPIALGEFWYGTSPRGEVRHHGHFYGACRGRCHPILSFMLRGIDVAEVEAKVIPTVNAELTTLYEDEHIVIFNKPSGMLSVPGRSAAISVKDIVESRYPKATGAMMVHRLDQDTSGVLVVAKSGEVHKILQRQFAERKLSKRYIAITEGVIKQDRGEIELPLRPNIDDRPRQMVDYKYGKKAKTTYKVLERGESTTRLALYPHTGRTHQLRLHCAHVDGLNTPIIGDRLYSREVVDSSNCRLHLHAESITFTHPISGEKLCVNAPSPF